jgi:O-acetylhomoserine (thiol)-lyase
MKEDKQWGFATKAIHYGQSPDPGTGAINCPIYQTSSFGFGSAQEAAEVFLGEREGYAYSRISNPTNDLLERKMAALEGGEAALATASGMAAISTAIFTLLGSGDEIVASKTLYGGNYHLFEATLPKLGIKTRFAEPDDLTEWEKAINNKTKLLFAETPGNPKLNLLDLEAISRLARSAEIPLMVDNTLSSPYLLQPISLGADIVVHSATKFICGNGSSMGGVIIGKTDFINEARGISMRDLGPALSPFNAWLLLLGLETLAVRMEWHSRSAQRVAEYLNNHPRVAWVSYPGLPSHPQHQLAKKQMKNGFGGMISFGVKGGLVAGKSVMNRIKLCTIVANLGDSRSLIIHPASTTHQLITPEQQLETGVTPDLIRLSVGLENPEDIIADLEQALV